MHCPARMNVHIPALSLIIAAALIAGMIVGIASPWGESTAESSASELNEENLPDLPDIKQIYDECLTEPFGAAGAEIEDPEIKAYYERLLAECGLDRPEDQGEDPS